MTCLMRLVILSDTDKEDKPLVLLDRADITAELAALQERLQGSENAEETWAAGLKEKLDNMCGWTNVISMSC